MLVKRMDLKQEKKLNKNQKTSSSTWQEEFSEKMSWSRAIDLHESRPNGFTKDGTKQLPPKAILRLQRPQQTYINQHIVKSNHSNVELLMQKLKLLLLQRNVNKICQLLQRKQKVRKERRVKRMRRLQKRLMRHLCLQLSKNKKMRNLTQSTQLNSERHYGKGIQDHLLSDQQNSRISIQLKKKYLSMTKMPDKQWSTDLIQQSENQSSA